MPLKYTSFSRTLNVDTVRKQPTGRILLPETADTQLQQTAIWEIEMRESGFMVVLKRLHQFRKEKTIYCAVLILSLFNPVLVVLIFLWFECVTFTLLT